MSKAIAGSACDLKIANLLIDRVSGNPAKQIRDFQSLFPVFKPRHSLDHPVKVFALGDPQSGKSTLIKALQGESTTSQLRGITLVNVHGVDNHKVGLVPTDFTSRWMNSRVVFYDLASSRDLIHENLIQSADDVATSVFIVCVNLKEDRKDIGAKMLFWMNFVHDQCAQFCSAQTKPSVAIVGSFSDVPRLFSLIPPQRLHLEYNDMVANERFSSRFTLLRKYSMDCRKEASLPLYQLRSALKRHFQNVHQVDGNTPSRWYILSIVLETEFPEAPAVKLRDLKTRIAMGSGKNGLFALLPQTAEELLQLCQYLEERERVILIKPSGRSDIESTWIVHRSHQLLSLINAALVNAPGSTELTGSSAIMTQDDLKECFSTTIRPLSFDVLVQLMERFLICKPVTVEEMAENQLFYIPGLLPKEHEVPLWDHDSNYCFRFAWALVPADHLEFFLPRFLKFLLLRLLTIVKSAEFNNHTVWSEGICFSGDQGKIDICVMVNDMAIVLNMRCKKDHRIDCLTYRNQILEQIRASKESYQSQIQTKELILPSTPRAKFPLRDIHSRRLAKIDVAELKRKMLEGTGSAAEPLPFFEPYLYLRRLPDAYRHTLTNVNNTSLLMSRDTMSELVKCFGNDKWKSLADHFQFPQPESDADTVTISTEGSESTEELMDGGMILECGYFLDRLSSISIFEEASLREALQGAPPILKISPESHHSVSADAPASSIDPQSQSNPIDHLRPPDDTSSSKSSAPGEPSIQWPANFSGSSSEAINTTPEVLHALLGHIEKSNASPSPSTDSDIVQFTDHLQVIKVDSTGGEFEYKPHQVFLTVPGGAVATSASIEIGVALQGEFVFDKDTKPFSPVVMVRMFEGSPVKTRVKLTIPHCLTLADNDSNPTVLEAIRRKGRRLVFSKVKGNIRGGKATFSLMLSKSTSSYYCIGCKTTPSTVSSTNYCIVKVIPKTSESIWHLVVCISYFLQTCIEMVRKQFPEEEYVVSTQGFRFRPSEERDPSIGIVFKRLEDHQWRITKEGVSQIKSQKIDFSDKDAAALIDNQAYPPRFKLQVNGKKAKVGHLAVVMFTGVYPLYGTPEDALEVEVDLQPTSHRRRLSGSVSSIDIADTTSDDDYSVGSMPMLQRGTSIRSSKNSINQVPVLESHPSQAKAVTSVAETPHYLLPRHSSWSSFRSTISDDPEMTRGTLSPKTSLQLGPQTRRWSHAAEYEPDFVDFLTRHWVVISQKLNLLAIRPYLRQHHVVTKAEHRTLCGHFNPAQVEILLHMIDNAIDCDERIRRFIDTLRISAASIPDHCDILTELSQDPQYHTLVSMPSNNSHRIQVGSRHSVR